MRVLLSQARPCSPGPAACLRPAGQCARQEGARPAPWQRPGRGEDFPTGPGPAAGPWLPQCPQRPPGGGICAVTCRRPAARACRADPCAPCRSATPPPAPPGLFGSPCPHPQGSLPTEFPADHAAGEHRQGAARPRSKTQACHGAGRNSGRKRRLRAKPGRKQDAQGSGWAFGRPCAHTHVPSSTQVHTHTHTRTCTRPPPNGGWNPVGLNSASTSCGNVGLQAAPGPQMCAVWPPESQRKFLEWPTFKNRVFSDTLTKSPCPGDSRGLAGWTPVPPRQVGRG